ncbi:MAG: thioredoxin domain-containing protein [Bdellovibrionales bacterium]
MKKLLPAIAIAAIAIAPQIIPSAHAMEKEAMMEKKIEAPATKAVQFHADWCGACKILAPKMEEVMNNLDEDTKAKFALVKFDLTDDTTKAASKKTAMENDVTSAFPAGDGKPPTGVIKLIDSKTGDVLAKIHYKMSVEEITGLIKGVTARA